jgi:hypothetical protein
VGTSHRSGRPSLKPSPTRLLACVCPPPRLAPPPVAIRGRNRVSSSVHSRHRDSTPTPSLASIHVLAPARCSGHTAPSPGLKPQRLPPPGSAARSPLAYPTCETGANRPLGESPSLPYPLPTDPSHHLAGIRQGPPAVCPRDPVAGISVKYWKVPGA